ncbi:hypothetical protein AB7849_15150 [Rhodanobacter sp. 115]|uniref:hypothetical protein n=1 Tax=Rhodanobacter sp. FW021-MT20 TaxID=1162282 RepID=UPI0034E5DC68
MASAVLGERESDTKNELPYRWRPSRCTETQKVLNGSGKELGEIYFGTSKQEGSWEAIAYCGRSAKHSWYIGFRSKDRLDEKMASFAANLQQHEERKTARAAERKKPHSLVVGDVLKASWGYDQTNVDYYQVTRVTARCVWVRAIAAESSSTGSMQGDCVPRPDVFLKNSKETRHVVNGDYVKIDSVRSASRVPFREVGGVKVYPVAHWTSWA